MSTPAPIAPAEVAAERAGAEPEADRDRGEDRQQARRGELAQRVLGADVDDAAVVRPLGEVHDPGLGAELVAHLEDDPAGGAADTALIARPLNRNTTAAPMIRPTRMFGCDDRCRAYAAG